MIETAVDADSLVRMANRIGEFFAAAPDRDEAIEGIAQHIARFREPRMRRQIVQLLDGAAGDALAPLVAEALRVNRARLTPSA